MNNGMYGFPSSGFKVEQQNMFTLNVMLYDLMGL